MHRELIRDALLVSLAKSYEIDSSRFVTLSKQTLDSSFTREVLSELRNLGYLEEQVRGIRSSHRRGYQVYRNDPLPYACPLETKGLPLILLLSCLALAVHRSG